MKIISFSFESSFIFFLCSFLIIFFSSLAQEISRNFLDPTWGGVLEVYGVRTEGQGVWTDLAFELLEFFGRRATGRLLQSIFISSSCFSFHWLWVSFRCWNVCLVGFGNSQEQPRAIVGGAASRVIIGADCSSHHWLLQLYNCICIIVYIFHTL